MQYTTGRAEYAKLIGSWSNQVKQNHVSLIAAAK